MPQKYVPVRLLSKQEEKHRADIFRKRKYGISGKEYDALRLKQNGVCAICRRKSVYKGKERRLSVDHHHTTGKVRGLLCLNCNLAIGHLQDNPLLARTAADYLELYPEGDISDVD